MLDNIPQRLQKVFQWIGLIVIFTLIAACHQPTKDSQYFLQHPDQIETVYERCEKMLTSDVMNDPLCTAALQAAQQIRPLVIEAAQNPLAFGKKILDLQITAAKTANDLNAAQQQLLNLQQDPIKNAVEIKQQQQKLVLLQQELIQKQTAITTMSRIIKLLRPISQ